MAKLRKKGVLAAQLLRETRSRRTGRRRLMLEHLESRLFQSGTPIGVNLEEIKDWSRSFMFVDAMKSARQFGSAAAPWDQSATLDANGWPTGDAGTCVITLGGATIPGQSEPRIDGTYAFSATGQVTVSPIASNAFVTNWHYDAATNRTTADVVVRPGSTQLFLSFTGAVGGAKDIRLIRPGYAADTQQVFTNEFLSSLANVTTLRLMDYLQTNNNPVANWNDRSHVTDATQATEKGGAWEYAIDLANMLHKDLWINIPVLATDDYVDHLAGLLKATLDPTLHVYLEYSNEVWNGSFGQSGTNFQLAQSDMAAGSDLNYDHSDNPYYWGWRHVPARLISIKNDFAAVYGQDAINTTIRPVLASQIGWSYVLENQLDYLESRFGPDLSSQIYGIAGAPYLSIGDLSWSPTLTADQVLGALHQNMISNQEGIAKYASMAAYHGIKQLYYEGGIDLTGDVSGNLAAKIAANYDPAVSDLVRQYFEYAAADGVDQVMFFNLAGAYSWSGTWGLTESIQDLSGAKYAGFVAASKEDRGPITLGNALPVGTGASSVDGASFTLDTYGSGGSPGILRGVWGGSRYDYLLNIASSGQYALRTSAGNGSGTLELFVDGRDIGQVSVSAGTGQYTLQPPIDLATGLGGANLGTGLHTLRLQVLSGHFDIAGLTLLGGDDALPAATAANVAADGADSSSMLVSWSHAAGASGYVIERSVNGIDGWVKAGTVGADAVSFRDAGLGLGKSYSYRVLTTGLGGDSGYSAVATGTTRFLVTPSNVQATEKSATAIDLSWAPVANAMGYRLDWSLDESEWKPLVDLDGSQTSYHVSDLDGATKYFYRITAYSKDGDSTAGTAGTMTKAVDAPGNLRVTAIDGTSLQVAWDDVPDAANYIVERSTDGQSDWVEISVIDAGTLSYLDGGLESQAVYYYRTKAIGPGGESAYSSVAGMTTAVIVSNRPLPASDTPASNTPASDTSTAETPASDTSTSSPVTAQPADPVATPTPGDATSKPTDTPVATTPATPPAPSTPDPVVVAPTPVVPTMPAVNPLPIVTPSPVAVSPAPAADAGKPSEVIATATINAIRVSWSNVKNAVEYAIERCAADGNWTSVGTTRGTSLTDAALAADTRYTYRITAITTSGARSEVSQTASAQTARRTNNGWSFWWW